MYGDIIHLKESRLIQKLYHATYQIRQEPVTCEEIMSRQELYISTTTKQIHIDPIHPLKCYL